MLSVKTDLNTFCWDTICFLQFEFESFVHSEISSFCSDMSNENSLKFQIS